MSDEPYWAIDELPTAVAQLARPERLVVAYFPSVDYHAHVAGQASPAYREAMTAANAIWDRLVNELDPAIGLLATGDHGHIDIEPAAKHRMSSQGLVVYGDPRALLLSGDADEIRRRLGHLPGELVSIADAQAWWGPGPAHPELEDRLPDWVFLPAPDTVALPGFMDDRMVGYHGGLEPGEAKVPLIVREPLPASS